MNTRSGITWTKLVIGLGLMCLMLSFGALAQTNPEKPLDEDAVSELFGELTAGLTSVIEDEAQIDAITAKWEAREELGGKTKSQILKLLFDDVKSVVKDQQTQNKIWSTWNQNEEIVDQAPVAKPVVPANLPTRSALEGTPAIIRPMSSSAGPIKWDDMVRIMEFFDLAEVCSAADMKIRPGSRFAVGGRCFRNMQEAIPSNNSPTYYCEKVHGTGNCVVIKDTVVAGADQQDRQWAVKKCSAGSQFYSENLNRGGNWDYRLFCARNVETPKTPTTSGETPKPIIWIKMVHDGAYSARFHLTWDEPNKPNNSRTAEGKFKGFEQRIVLPENATNIRLKIEAATGLVWDPWGEVINKVLQPNELNRCYRAHGTTLNRLWDNNCQ